MSDTVTGIAATPQGRVRLLDGASAPTAVPADFCYREETGSRISGVILDLAWDGQGWHWREPAGNGGSIGYFRKEEAS